MCQKTGWIEKHSTARFPKEMGFSGKFQKTRGILMFSQYLERKFQPNV